MRLRQICCHPGLIDPKYLKEESAKMNALFYLLDQLHEEGHKVLVFSQFVSMLDIIKARLERREPAIQLPHRPDEGPERARSRTSRRPRTRRCSCSR